MRYVMVLFFAMFQSTLAVDNSVVLVDNLIDAVALSEDTKKPILVIFTSEDCKFCSIMKEDLNKNPKILNGYILCYVDFSETQLVKEYKVRTIPDYFILDNKVETKRKVGYKNIETFKIWLDK